MALKLQKLPDRTPVRLNLMLSPDLHRRLEEYVKLYREEHGVAEPLGELVPAMLASFLDSDRAFVAHAKAGRKA
ncbi:MAG: DUF2274 domain-containing protein [Sphingomonadaceae bacterium]|nr:DUF2274 domain-containing protein [Sphingomonadaceae bacterium]